MSSLRDCIFFNGTIRRPYGLRYKIMPLQGIQM